MGTECLEFSTTSERGQFSAICQNGNEFYLGNPDGLFCPPVTGLVNGSSTGSLPMCQMVTDKTFETSGAIELLIRGQKIKLMDRIEEGPMCRMPEQVKVHIGIAPPPPPAPPMTPVEPKAPAWDPSQRSNRHVPIGQVSSARMPGQMGSVRVGDEMNALDVLSELNAQRGVYASSQGDEARLDAVIIEADNPAGAPADGEYDAESAGLELLSWYQDEMGKIAKMVGGQAIKIGDLLLTGQNWEVLRKEGLTKFQIKTINGKKTIVLKGAPRLRSVLTGTRYTLTGLGKRKVTVLNAAARSLGENVKAGVAGIAKRAGAIGLVFVCTIDVVEHLSKEGTDNMERLIADLGFNVIKAVLSGIVGTVVSGMAIAFAGTLGAPVVVAVGAGLLAAFFVGWVISKAVDATGLEDAAKRSLDNAILPVETKYLAYGMGLS